MDETALVWSFNPWRDQRGWRHPAVALLLLLGVAALAGYSFGASDGAPQAVSWGIFALAILLGMTASLFLPARYRLDDKGVTVYFPFGVPSFRPWSHYRNYYVHDTGVHLTTMPKPSSLDPFRGHLLLFNANREEVVAIIRENIRRETPKAAAAPD